MFNKKTPKNNDDCVELKNINYKNMLLNGTTLYEHKNTNDMNNLDKFLENEKKNSKMEQWSKLDKCEKIKKIVIFADSYKNINNLNNDDEQKLIKFLKELLDKKMLQRVKDIIYDKEKGEIKDIPGLFFNKQHKKFTIKNTSVKHVSTLKTLAPKKKNINTTIKNTNNITPIKILSEETQNKECNAENLICDDNNSENNNNDNNDNTKTNNNLIMT